MELERVWKRLRLDPRPLKRKREDDPLDPLGRARAHFYEFQQRHPAPLWALHQEARRLHSVLVGQSLQEHGIVGSTYPFSLADVWQALGLSATLESLSSTLCDVATGRFARFQEQRWGDSDLDVSVIQDELCREARCIQQQCKRESQRLLPCVGSGSWTDVTTPLTQLSAFPAHDPILGLSLIDFLDQHRQPSSSEDCVAVNSLHRGIFFLNEAELLAVSAECKRRSERGLQVRSLSVTVRKQPLGLGRLAIDYELEHPLLIQPHHVHQAAMVETMSCFSPLSRDSVCGRSLVDLTMEVVRDLVRPLSSPGAGELLIQCASGPIAKFHGEEVSIPVHAFSPEARLAWTTDDQHRLEIKHSWRLNCPQIHLPQRERRWLGWAIKHHVERWLPLPAGVGPGFDDGFITRSHQDTRLLYSDKPALRLCDRHWLEGRYDPACKGTKPDRCQAEGVQYRPMRLYAFLPDALRRPDEVAPVAEWPVLFEKSLRRPTPGAQVMSLDLMALAELFPEVWARIRSTDLKPQPLVLGAAGGTPLHSQTFRYVPNEWRECIGDEMKARALVSGMNYHNRYKFRTEEWSWWMTQPIEKCPNLVKAVRAAHKHLCTILGKASEVENGSLFWTDKGVPTLQLEYKTKSAYCINKKKKPDCPTVMHTRNRTEVQITPFGLWIRCYDCSAPGQPVAKEQRKTNLDALGPLRLLFVPWLDVWTQPIDMLVVSREMQLQQLMTTPYKSTHVSHWQKMKYDADPVTDLPRLKAQKDPGMMISDSFITNYILRLGKEAKFPDLARIGFMPSSYFQRFLTEEKVKAQKLVERLRQGTNDFQVHGKDFARLNFREFDLILIVEHISDNHWVLWVFRKRPSSAQLFLLNSLQGYFPSEGQDAHAKKIIQALALMHGNEDQTFPTGIAFDPMFNKVKQQGRGTEDCGVYVMEFAHFVMQYPWDFETRLRPTDSVDNLQSRLGNPDALRVKQLNYVEEILSAK